MSADNKPVVPASDAGKEKEEVSQEVEASPTLSVEPDYKELLRLEIDSHEKTRGDKDNYKEGMLSYKAQLKANKRNEGEVADESDVNEKIKAAVGEALSPVVEALQGSKIEQILSSVVSDPAKREYVKALYNNRIQKSGANDEAIRRDIETALNLADSTRFAKENEELKRMKDNGVYVPPAGGGGTADRGVPVKLHKWTPEQEASLEQRARMNGITDTEKYKQLAWKAANEGSAFEVKKKYID